MKTIALSLVACCAGLVVHGAEPAVPKGTPTGVDSELVADRFADIQILRYKVPGFDELSLKQKKLAYYLTQAGLAGRDIFYDQKFKHNLAIRKTLEGIIHNYKGDKSADEFQKLLVYAKRVFFSNGIHHHYSNSKFIPEFSREFFARVIESTPEKALPLEGKSKAEFTRSITPVMFDAKVAPKLVDLSPDVDNVKASAVNFYEGVTEEEVEKYYDQLASKPENKLLSLGLNTKVVKENGRVTERTWKIGGMYDPAIREVVKWLRKAVEVAENETQARHLKELIRYYETGDLEAFNEHCVLWVKETDARIDVVNGFIEVYQDPMHKKGSFESVVSMKDTEASKRIAAISEQAQWFEDQSPIMDEHKKKNVVGISAKVITVIGEVGDAASSTPP